MHAASPLNPREDDLISAFVDGELSAEMAQAALRRVQSNPEERRRFDEYCAVGDALRGLPGRCPDLTARVMAALEREPTLLAPMSSARRLTPRPPLMWAAAAAVAVLTWGLWSALPQPTEAPLPMAARSAQPDQLAAAYLAAHQDYAQAVLSPTEMQFTRVSLVEAGR